MPNRYYTPHPEHKISSPGKGAAGVKSGKKASVNVTHPKWSQGARKVKCHAKSTLY